jgi:hypothetical protein
MKQSVGNLITMGLRNKQPSGQRRDQRGQTTLDFVIGISVFLSVLLFILLFLPGILAPFTTSTQAETVSSNRVADQFATGLLASPDDPYVLDRHCTAAFFDVDSEPDSSAPARCGYSTGTLSEQVGVASAHQNLNVSLRGNISTAGDGDDLLCWDTDSPDRGLVESGDTACDPSGTDDFYLTRGDPTPETIPSVTSVRVVSLDGQDATLYVELW